MPLNVHTHQEMSSPHVEKRANCEAKQVSTTQLQLRSTTRQRHQVYDIQKHNSMKSG